MSGPLPSRRPGEAEGGLHRGLLRLPGARLGGEGRSGAGDPWRLLQLRAPPCFSAAVSRSARPFGLPSLAAKLPSRVAGSSWPRVNACTSRRARIPARVLKRACGLRVGCTGRPGRRPPPKVRRAISACRRSCPCPFTRPLNQAASAST